MEISFWSEEDLKNKVIIPCLVSKGFSLSEMEFEKSFSLRVGTKNIVVRSDVLLKIKGRPMIVIEVKRPEHTIDSSDIDQAISYARLCQKIAPFALVTNLEQTKLFDTYSRGEITSVPTLKGFSEEEFKLDEDFKTEALKTLLKLDYGFLQDFCQSQRDVQMLHLQGSRKSMSRFAKELYLNREGAEQEFEAFLNSSDKCFILLGKQGTGKTFSMISLSQLVGKRIPTLFYDAPYVPRRIAESIEEDFCWGSKQRTWYGDIINQVDSILKKHHAQMVIFVDSVNEAIPRSSIKRDIIDLLRRLYQTSIKLCLACRTEDWKFFCYDKGEPGLFSSLVYYPHEERQTAFVESELEGSTKIGDFSDRELDLVFPKYKEVFDLKSGLSQQARLSCRHPETLRMVSEVYSHSEIPLSLRRKKILEKYWSKKLECTGNSEIAEPLLLKIGESILGHKSLEVKEKEVVELTARDSMYQEVYMKAKSENLLQSRKDAFGNSYIRITPNLLSEYVLARNLVEEFNKRPIEKKDVASFVDEISQSLKGFPLHQGSILLFCSILGNPPQLVRHLLESVELTEIIDQILDENPSLLKSILGEADARDKIRRALLEQDIWSSCSVLIKLLEKYENANILAIELLLSKEAVSKERFDRFLGVIFDQARFSQSFDLLLKEVEQMEQKQLVAFLYKVHLANDKIAEKILLRFKIGKLKNLIKSCPDRTECGRSLFLISMINARVARLIDPSERLLEEFQQKLKKKKVKLPDVAVIFRKEACTSKEEEEFQTKILSLLGSVPEGYTWAQITEKTRIDKYATLASLEQLAEASFVYRERLGNGFVYKVHEGLDESFKRTVHKYIFPENNPSIKEFARRIIESGFNLERAIVDDLLEEMSLGKYFLNWEICLHVSFEIVSCSIDLAIVEQKNVMEIHGKTFSFWINWLFASNGIGKSTAKSLVKNMSESAPKMFKNLILGIRVRQHHRESLNGKITNRIQLLQTIDEFTRFFGSTGVKTPTEEEIFCECVRTLKQLTDTEGPVRNSKTITFFKSVKEIFNNPQTLAEIEMKIDLAFQT